MADSGAQQATSRQRPLRGSVTGWVAVGEIVLLLLTLLVLLVSEELLDTGDSNLSWAPLLHAVIAVPAFAVSVLMIGIAEFALRRSIWNADGWVAVAVLLVVGATVAHIVLSGMFGAGGSLAVAATAFGATLALTLAAPRTRASRRALLIAAGAAGCLLVWSLADLLEPYIGSFGP